MSTGVNKMANKLELTWVGKDEEIKLEPRILIENPKLSNTEKEKDTENMLIHGDNLLTLKALESKYAGQIKCIYIDPPYNTGSRIDADGNEIGYDDGIEHSIWLSLMKARLLCLKNLLSEDGSIWISIDEKEGHYLKVLCDEVFGRNNYVIQVTIKRGSVSGHKAINPTPVQICDFMLVYAKDKEKWVYHPVYKERDYDKAYNQFIENIDAPYSEWKFIPLSEAMTRLQLNIDKIIEKYSAQVIRFAQPDYKGVGQETRDLIDLSKQNPSVIYKQTRIGYPDIYLLNGNRILFYRDKLKMINGKMVTAELVTNLWDDMNYQGIASEGGVRFQKGKKPEAQIKRVLEMATQEGDYVLDSFLGSGTTIAVATKMKRKWIGVELGPHCYSHCKKRIDLVIDGENKGISKAVNWHGGGGYKFYELAPSLIVEDKFGNPVINKEYNADMLAAAMALHEGFKYAPDANFYWKQGKNENAYIYTTTAHLTEAHLDAISKEMKEGEYLVIACKSYDSGIDKLYKNIKVKKIPQYLLGRCEFGKDNYNLNIIDVPTCEEDEDE